MPVHQMGRTPHLEGAPVLEVYETFFSLLVGFAGMD